MQCQDEEKLLLVRYWAQPKDHDSWDPGVERLYEPTSGAQIRLKALKVSASDEVVLDAEEQARTSWLPMRLPVPYLEPLSPNKVIRPRALSI